MIEFLGYLVIGFFVFGGLAGAFKAYLLNPAKRLKIREAARSQSQVEEEIKYRRRFAYGAAIVMALFWKWSLYLVPVALVGALLWRTVHVVMDKSEEYATKGIDLAMAQRQLESSNEKDS